MVERKIGVEPNSKRGGPEENEVEEGEQIEISGLKRHFSKYDKSELKTIKKAAQALKAFDQGGDSKKLIQLISKNPFLEESSSKLGGKTPLIKLRGLIERGLI